MKLNDFIGNEKVVQQLGSLIESKRFPHAIVIDGERGIGKKTLARLLACALVCRGEEKPCMSCAQCHKAINNIHPDVSEYIPSGALNSFHVDTVRDIIKDAYLQPNEADFKVYILAEAHCMNASAQNALLKILEEPPEYAVFILTTQSKSALLNTVLSRSVVVSLEGVDINEGAKYICSKVDSISFDTAKAGMETFNGNIGRTIESLQDSKTSELVQACENICKALVDDNEYSLLKECAIFQKDRQSIVFSCELLKNIFRDALVAGDNVDYISGQNEISNLLKNRLTRKKLVDLIYTCDDLKIMAQMNANNALLITKICYSLRQAIGR